MKVKQVLSIAVCAALLGSNAQTAFAQYDASPKGASTYTIEENKKYFDMLDFDDNTELEFANRGFIDAPETLTIKGENGAVIWSQDAYGYLDENENPPDTMNPSLWRHTKLNHIYGLFKVKEGIYQVRGYDMANLTLIQGDKGWIVFDPLMSVETAAAAMELANKNLGERPVSAVVISHSHIDHYGGIKGVITEEDVASGKIPVIAPEGLDKHVAGESVYAGNAMGRRAEYQYGLYLPKNETGAGAIGIGMGQSAGTYSYIRPTKYISETGERLTIDGVTMEFQMTPGTEAPVEMNTFFPEHNALWMAENCTGTLHNLYTLRGAEIRDGNAWSNFIGETISLYGGKFDVIFQAHNWPHFGEYTVISYLENTARVYKAITDQTLRLINMGYTQNEVSQSVKLTPEMEKVWYTRQYYGTVSHNAKAVYQKYMGWYDANPANLNPLPPEESSVRLVEYMGGAEAVMERAKKDFDEGNYRFVAQVLNAVVFAEPENTQAKLLLADAYEQMAYQAESGTWRNAYLAGAMELRTGRPGPENSLVNIGDTAKSLTPPLIFDYLGILIEPRKAEGVDCGIQINVTGGEGGSVEKWYLSLKSGTLIYWNDNGLMSPDVTVEVSRGELLALFFGRAENAVVEGDMAKWANVLGAISPITQRFNIVTP